VIRAFIAAFPPAAARHAIAHALRGVRGQTGSNRALRWLPEANYHVTLRFLGSIIEAEPVVAALRTVEATGAICCAVNAIVPFPNARRPSVCALMLDSGGELEALAARVNRALIAMGEPDKPFRSHLTVARCRNKVPHLDADLQLSFRLDEFGLYRSETLPEGARYSALATFGLA
jgi:2'-5' RNA ligase